MALPQIKFSKASQTCSSRNLHASQSREVSALVWFTMCAGVLFAVRPAIAAPPTAPAAPGAAPPVAATTTTTDVSHPAANVTAPESGPTDDQLNKFKSIFNSATKIFGDEHTVISPSFFYATDLNGRLGATGSHQGGLSAVLMVPLWGLGGGHGSDWWPVIVSSDETKIYQSFLDRVSQYQLAAADIPKDVQNAKTIGAMANTGTAWDDVQNLAVARQLFCQEEVDPTPVFSSSELSSAIKLFCKSLSTTSLATTEQAPATKAATNTVTRALKEQKNALVPRRQNLLFGPSLGIPLTKNPTDIFQFGASAEVGGDSFRFMASGGLIGKYSGPTYKDMFAAGWFVGIALSGEMGDELFHYFNGGSNLMSQLASLNGSTPGSP